MTIVRYLSMALALAALATVNTNIAAATPADAAPKYVVKDGKVDKATYNGYRRFHGTCHVCHGQDALGGSFAPALAESLKTVDYDTFVKTVMEGRQVTDATGAVKAMPPFGQDPNVAKHLDDIYRYIKARADGVLPPGRPKKIPK